VVKIRYSGIIVWKSIRIVLKIPKNVALIGFGREQMHHLLNKVYRRRKTENVKIK